VEMESVPEEKEEPTKREAKAEEAPAAGEEEPAEEISPLEALDETIKIKPGEHVEMEPVPEEKEEPTKREAKAEEAPAAGEEEPTEEISPLEALDETIKIKPEEKLKRKAEKEEKRGAGGESAQVTGFPKRRASDALEILEKYKKTEPEEEAEVAYYENDDKKILDSECIVSAICNRLEEAEKLYKKLAKTESPIDQFFVKQEIIRSQEALRGVILAGTRMLEKESSTLPLYTIGIVNIDVLKEILEKLSMQNWSKKTDFRLFNEYAAKLKRDYYARISSLVDYLKSLIDELGLEF
jgi:translation initiation factor 2 beta subunit (eIF-2beta)/eIF-5